MLQTRFPMKSKHIVAFGTIAAVGFILCLRKPDSLRNPQFVAEDGTIFFIGARQLGIQSLLTPYGGYLHVLPRFVAFAAGFFDPLWTPTVYNSVALCFDVVAIAMLFSPRVKLPAKPVLAFSFALVPHDGEVFLSLTNIQWCLALVLILLLLQDDPSTASQRWLDRSAISMCGLTGPFICFLSPLFVMRAALRRTRESAMLAIFGLIVAAIQAGYIYTDRSHFTRFAPADPRGLIFSMVTRLFGTFWTGYGTVAAAYVSFWIAISIAVTTFGIWFSFRSGEWRYQRMMLTLAWLCFVVPVAMKFLHEASVIRDPGNGDRYFFLPHVLLAWLLVIACVQMSGWLRAIPVTLLAASLVFNLPYISVAPLRDFAWAKHVQPVRDGESFEIPINPNGLIMEGRAMDRPP